jgi:hypothetical protein
MGGDPPDPMFPAGSVNTLGSGCVSKQFYRSAANEVRYAVERPSGLRRTSQMKRERTLGGIGRIASVNGTDAVRVIPGAGARTRCPSRLAALRSAEMLRAPRTRRKRQQQRFFCVLLRVQSALRSAVPSRAEPAAGYDDFTEDPSLALGMTTLGDHLRAAVL